MRRIENMRKNFQSKNAVLKRGAGLLLAIATAATFVTGCGKGDKTADSTGEENLSEFVYTSEYIPLNFSKEENTYYDDATAQIEGDKVSIVKSAYSEEDEESVTFFDVFDLTSGELVSETNIGGNVSEFVDVKAIIPEEHKEKAKTSVSVNNVIKMENGGFVASVNYGWYVEQPDPENYDESLSGYRSGFAFLDEDGNITSFKEYTGEELGITDGSYMNGFYSDGKGNIIALYMDWSGENVKVSLIKLDSELNIVTTASPEVQGINGIIYEGEKSLIVYNDKDWETKIAEFNNEDLTIGTPFELSNDVTDGGINAITYSNNKFYFASYDKFYEYDAAAKETKQLFAFLDIDVVEGTVNKIYVAEDGTIYLFAHNYETGETELIKVTEKTRSEVTQKKEIVIASLYEDYDVKNSVVQFNKLNPDVHVTLKSYFSWENEGADIKDATATMLNDITSSGKIDIINLSSLDVNDYVSQHVIEDLTPYLTNSTDVKLEDFNEDVVNAYRFGDTLVAVPYSYTLNTLAVSKDLFGDKPGLKMSDMIEYDLAHPDMALSEYVSREELIQLCLVYNIDYFVNRQTGECKFDSDEFKQILEYLKTYPEEIDWEAAEADNYTPMEKLANGLIMSYPCSFYNFQSVQEYNDYIFAGKANFIGFPTIDGTPSAKISATGVYSICSGSKNKDSAWEFIEFMLTKEFTDSDWGFPTNKNEYKKLLDKELSKTGLTGSGMSYGDGPMYEYHYATQEEIDTLNRILSEAKVEDSGSGEIFKIIEEETGSYFAGQKTLDETAKIIQSRVSIYVQENR